MTIEEFNNLPLDTKKKLMLHWWHYYGKEIYTLEELEKFIALLEIDFAKMLEIAVANFMFNEGPTPLLIAMRKNLVSKMLEQLPNIDTLPQEEREAYDNIKTNFINEIVSTSEIDLSSGRK